MDFIGNGVTVISVSEGYNAAASGGTVTITPKNSALPQFVQISQHRSVALTEIREVQIYRGQEVSFQIGSDQYGTILDKEQSKLFLERYGQLFFSEETVSETLKALL